MTRIFLIGYMGSGKTTYGRAAAKALGLSFLDLDIYIEERFFKSVSDIFAEKGEDGFRKIEQHMLHEAAMFEDVLIACGGGTPCFFDNMDFMNAEGTTVYLKSSAETLVDNLKNARQNRPLLRDKTETELLQYIRENLEKREPFYLQAQKTIDCDDQPENVIKKLVNEIKIAKNL